MLEAAGSEETFDLQCHAGIGCFEHQGGRPHSDTRHFAFDPAWIAGLLLLRNMPHAEFDDWNSCRRITKLASLDQLPG